MVYFIRAGKRIKIGITSNLPSRLRALQTGNAETCEVIFTAQCFNDRETESLIHRQLEAYRVNLEWFEVSFTKAFEAFARVAVLDDPHREQEWKDCLLANPRFVQYFEGVYPEERLPHVSAYTLHEAESSYRRADELFNGNLEVMIKNMSPVTDESAKAGFERLRAQLRAEMQKPPTS